VDPKRHTNEVTLFYFTQSPLYITNLAVGIETIGSSVNVHYEIHATFICMYRLVNFNYNSIDEVHFIYISSFKDTTLKIRD